MRALSLFLLAACSGGAEPTPERTPAVVPIAGLQARPVGVDADVPVDAPGLHARLLAEAPLGAAPTAVVIDLLHPVVSPDDTRKPAVFTRLVADPPVEGDLAWLSPSRLRFTIKGSLPPGSATTFTLSAVDGRVGDAVGAVELPEPATLRVEAPPLALHHARVAEAAPGSNVQVVEVAFSNAVDAATAQGRLSLRLPDGATVPASEVIGAAQPHVVRATFRAQPLASARSVDLLVAAGVQAVGGGAVPAGQAPVALPEAGKGRVQIKDVRLREGANGFVVEVLCDDPASDERVWMWDDELGDSWENSRRCELDPATLAHVRIEPAVPLTVAPVRAGFRLQGDLPRGAYALRLEAGLGTVDGGVLHTPWEGTLLVPGRQATLDLVASGRYLPRSAWTSLPLRHRNAGTVDLVVRHVDANNLLFWLSGDEEVADARTSAVVARARVAVGGAVDATDTRWLDLASLVPEPKPGLYEITASAHGAVDVARVAVTDLQLIAKAGSGPRPSWEVWSVDVHAQAPLPGTDVQLVRANGQVLARCTTGATGSCRLTPGADPLDTTEPLGLLASRREDFTFLKFSDVLLPNASSDVAGEPFHGEVEWRASLHTERGIYRPGEVAHVFAVLRTGKAIAPPADLAVRLDVQDARGRLVRQVPVRTNAAGMITSDLQLTDDAATGAWEARVVVADKVIARHRFQVEDFVPERMEVKASAGPAHPRFDEPVTVEVDAVYLFGGTAEGSRVEARCHVEPGTFAPAAWSAFRFGHQFTDDLPVRRLDLGAVTGTLDASGHAALACPTPGAQVVGEGRMVAEVAVFEAGGGRVSRSTTATALHPADRHIGLRTVTRRAEVGQAVDVQGVVVDHDGALASDVTSVDVELLHVESEWGWLWDDEEGYESWRHWRRPVLDGTLKVPVQGGRLRFSFTPASRGDGYVVRVRGAGASSDLLLDMDAWTWGEDVTVRTPRPPDPAAVVVQVPDAARVGERVDVRFEAPFAGKALLTVETDEVLHAEWVDVAAGEVTWSFELDAFVPNVYVGALILKDPHAESPDAWLPDRAWGAASVRVLPVDHALQLSLDVPSSTRSATDLPVTVRVDGEGPTYVVVAAVDEGILQLTRFETPDPLRDLFPRRALGVSTYETIGWSVARAQGAPGGDAAGSAPTRPPPIKPVALWSGLVEVTGGQATVNLPVPAWDGRLRVYAVAANAGRTAAAEARVTVADPLVVQATVPRYLLGGDEAQIPVRVTNATSAATQVEVALATRPASMGGFVADLDPLRVIGGQRTSLSLSAGESGLVVFRVAARPGAGAARLTVTAKGASFTATREHDLSVTPAAPTARRVSTVALQPGAFDVDDRVVGFVPGTERTSVWLTTSPHADALARVTDLLGYPHGCLEQTTSATRPLLFAATLLPGAVAELGGRDAIDKRVRAGIDRVLGMQTPSGGYAYWPGAHEPHLWGTAYALHLLLDARDAGHQVPAHAIDDAAAWLGGRLDALAARREPVAEGADAEAYAHYVLARAGQPRRGRAARLLEALDAGLTGGSPGRVAEARYLTRAALHLAGDRRHAAALRRFEAVNDPSRDGQWTFWSDLRRRGLTLAIFTDLFPNDPAGDDAARDLARAIASRPWLSTVEVAWAVTALGKRTAGSPAEVRSATLTAGGLTFEATTVAAGLPDRRWTVWRASERPDLRLTVDAGPGNLYAVLQSEGVRPDEPWRAFASGLEVSRTFRAADGTTLDPSALRLGDVVFVDLQLRASAGSVPNVAVVDHLPAGWEIENPRLTDTGEIGWAAGLPTWAYDHLDVRDAAVSFFGTLTTRPVHLVYAVRATSAGTYAVPPVEVSAMYDPGLAARTPSATTVVRGGWEASFL